MIRKTKQSRKYSSPRSMVTDMLLESNFCQTVRFNVRVQELDYINAKVLEEGEVAEPTYFEF